MICKTALIGLLGILLLSSPLAFSDSLVYTLTGTSADEQHSYRNTISVDDELVSEQEHIDYGRGDYIDVSVPYLIPEGFILRGATIDFTLAGSLVTTTNATSIPQPGFGNDYLPANIVTVRNSWSRLAISGSISRLMAIPTRTPRSTCSLSDTVTCFAKVH